MRGVLPILIAAAIACGCSDRQRLNPLDPGNPNTGGKPTGFAALAGDAGVTLRWTPAGAGDVTGYVLARRIAPATEFTTLATLDGRGVALYADIGLANGVDHTYRLQYRFGADRVGPGAEDTATPGPARPWVTDYVARTVMRLTPDARHVAETPPLALQSPSDLDVAPGTGLVWVCDPFAGQVVIHDPSTIVPIVIGGFLEPVAVAVDPADGHAWICDQGLDSLFRIDPARPDAPEVRRGGLASPLSVAVDPIDGSAWVCERTGDRVRHFGRDGTPIGATVVTEPSRVAVDSLTRSVWVTSFSQRRLVRLSSDGLARDTIAGFQGPIGVAIDSRRGQIWVADAADGRVYAYDRFGEELFSVPGLVEAREIAIDLPTGEAWVALPGAGQVVRLTAQGAIVRRFGGLSQPIDIALQVGR